MQSINKRKTFKHGLLAVSVACSTPVLANDHIEEILVTSEFHQKRLLELSNSVSVISTDAITARSATHLEQILSLAPNVNASSGASRGRFFQIRGIGERSQFVNPVNPSVGLLVDGVDFTGLGLAASTFDIQQVEVFRGPQGMLFGANALAGLINFTSPPPGRDFEGKIGIELGEYDKRVFNSVISGPLNEKISYRLGFQSEQSDGFIDNGFLNKNDTSDIDEKFFKGSLHYQVNDDLRLEFTGYYIDADNGYDDFSLVNKRSTTSDQPGSDKQESSAGAVKAIWTGSNAFDFELLMSALDADLEYGYDEDWSHVDEFDPGLFPYSSADSYERNRENLAIDFRFSSKAGSEIFDDTTSWTFGVYARDEQEQLDRQRFADLLPDTSFESEFETENYAVYGQLDSDLGDGWSLVAGVRGEQRNFDYQDSAGIDQDEGGDFWGGRIAINKQLSEDVLVYGLVSRGYKAGGVNAQIISAAEINPDISSSTFFFDEETLLNYELGLKGAFLNGDLELQVALFYQHRNDLQAKQSFFNPDDFSFDDYLTNADGSSQGIEIEYNYKLNGMVTLFGSLGFLEAEFKDFVSLAHVDTQSDPLNPKDIDGRDVAHAPNYQFSLGGQVQFTENLYLNVEVEGKDEFFFSNTHDEKSSSYELLHARLSYRADNWQVAIWGRNLTDENIEVRGFYFSNFFGNNPANGYAPETYVQLGEPRVVGISAKYDF